MSTIASNYDLKITRADDMGQALIQFTTVLTANVILKIMSADDKEVRILLNEQLTKGRHSVAFSYGNLSGKFHVRLVMNTPNAIDIETETIKI